MRIFYEVAKNKSFSRAADKLCITQPAVSIQIKRLEQCLGVRLIEKAGRELRLTEIGTLLYAYVREVFRLVEEAEEAIEKARCLKWGSLKLGATEALAQHFMSTVIATFQERYPEITVYLNEGNSEEMVEGVLEHRLEIAITGRIDYPKNLKFLPLGKNELLLVVSSRCELPFLYNDEISLTEILDKPIIFREKGSCSRKIMEEAFHKFGVEPLVIIEASNIDFIKDMVKRGKAISFLPRIAVEKDVIEGSLRLLRLKEGRLFIDIDLIYLDEKKLSPAAIAFKELLKEEKEKGSLF